MVFCGWICPKLSWNRYEGLRLPWTVSDPQTWALAHHILGWISLSGAVF
ncbi:SdpI family protein [Faecalibaculum rodentium]